MLRLSRAFSSARTLLQAVAPAVPLLDAAQCTLPRALVAVHGRDAAKFLNGLLTNRLPNAAPLRAQEPTAAQPPLNGVAQYCAMLNARGRVLADLFVYAAPAELAEKLEIGPQRDARDEARDFFVLDLDENVAESVVQTLEFHVLTSKVQIARLNGLHVRHVWSDVDELSVPEIANQTLLFTPDTRAAGLGFRCIVPQDKRLELGDSLVETDEVQFRLRRYLFGVPEGSLELVPNKSLPLDFCLDYMGGVDFQKGCYVGQELTIRTHHHGNVRKRVVPFVVAGCEDAETFVLAQNDDLAPGAKVTDDSPVPNANEFNNVFGTSPFKNSERAAGAVVASLGNVGLARVRVDVVGHEFRVGGTKIKAMVPFWWPIEEESV